MSTNNLPETENNTAHSTGTGEHHSWFEGVIQAIQDLDVDFPLSGGEHGGHHVIHHDSYFPSHENADQTGEVADTDQGTWLGHLVEKIQDLDTNFPLSGGADISHSHTH